MADIDAPRLIVTDALGRRILPLDKPTFVIGRRSEDIAAILGSVQRSTLVHRDHMVLL